MPGAAVLWPVAQFPAPGGVKSTPVDTDGQETGARARTIGHGVCPLSPPPRSEPGTRPPTRAQPGSNGPATSLVSTRPPL